MLDPSRLLQILINLITNAIRFTKNELTRTITVTLAASRTLPLKSLAGIPYLAQPNARPSVEEKRNSADDEIEGDENDENVVYLLVAVADTGCGMKTDELERIFLRFQQSSHKTHIEYGGSGLGLFISRELARLQGGQIGVHSEHGVGSTFEFYIKTRKCEAPKQAVKEKEPDVQLERYKQEQGPPPTTQTEKARHILLVEDNVWMSHWYLAMLRSQLTTTMYSLSTKKSWIGSSAKQAIKSMLQTTAVKRLIIYGGRHIAKEMVSRWTLYSWTLKCL